MFGRKKPAEAPATPAPGRHRKSAPRRRDEPAAPAEAPQDPCAGGHDTGIRYEDGATVIHCKRPGCTHAERYIG